MVHIKRFENFEEMNEGIKDWIAAALMLFSTPSFSSEGDTPKNSRVRLNDKQYQSTVYKRYSPNDTTTQKEIKELIRQGWNKDAQTIDTIWKETAQVAPDTNVICITAKLDGSTFFKLGAYKLSQETIDYLTKTLKTVLDTNGLVSKVEIIASTDKTPLSMNLKAELKKLGYEPTNAGLAKARSESIKKLLVDGVVIDGVPSPINAELIHDSTLVEMGKIDDKDHRFVQVNFKYIVPKSASTGTDKTPETQTTVKLTKVFDYKFQTPRKEVIGQVRTHKRLDECPKR